MRASNSGKGISGRLRTLGIGLAAALGFAAGTAHAADYPTHTITLVVPSTPGGGTDTQARILAPKLAEILGQSVIIENKGGASGNIGAQYVAHAAPDGYTLLAMISSHVMNPYVLKAVPYDINKSFAFITRTVTAPEVFVGNPSLPAKNLKDLIAYAKAHPGKLNFGSAGVGSLSHLIVELFEQRTGTRMTHVPYKATQDALQGTLSGQVDLMVPDLTIALGQIRTGKLISFGVTSLKRSPAAPELPTIAESGLPGFEAVQWFGLAAPAGTPKAIIDKLFAAATKALADPKIKEQYNKIAMTAAPSASPAAYTKFVREEGDRWHKVVTEAHIAAQ
ncbi:MAG TPA: tripartite tricarboxylate transporter substrate binding protein [Stellaceae bacterium]|nr:tripartite tricarboxylate transporter substrate binding protein [Stellaceae bacterium]